MRGPANNGTILLGQSVPEGGWLSDFAARAFVRYSISEEVPMPINSLNFRLPKHIIPVPTPEEKYQKLAPGVPDSELTREATGLLYQFSTPLLINHSHRVFWANELGRQTSQPYDAELLFCAAFHDLGLLKTFRSEGDQVEVDSANAVRQFLEHYRSPTRIQTAWDAISLHTTPGIAAYKPIEVELLYNGVGLDVLGIGYEGLDPKLRDKVLPSSRAWTSIARSAQAFAGWLRLQAADHRRHLQ